MTRGRFTLHKRLLTIICLLYCLTPQIIWGHLDREASATQETVLIFIPYEYIMCGLCLERFDAILDSLEIAAPTQHVWGIVTYPNVGRHSLPDTTLGLIAKQIRGLAKGRSIKCQGPRYSPVQVHDNSPPVLSISDMIQMA